MSAGALNCFPGVFFVGFFMIHNCVQTDTINIYIFLRKARCFNYPPLPICILSQEKEILKKVGYYFLALFYLEFQRFFSVIGRKFFNSIFQFLKKKHVSAQCELRRVISTWLLRKQDGGSCMLDEANPRVNMRVARHKPLSLTVCQCQLINGHLNSL